MDEAAEEKERPHGLQMSQAVEYRNEEDEMERRRVRRRLDPNAPAAEGDEGLGGGERRWIGMQKAIDADEGVGTVARRTRRSGAL